MAPKAAPIPIPAAAPVLRPEDATGGGDSRLAGDADVVKVVDVVDEVDCVVVAVCRG
jgi:hypothetical protein